MNAGLKVTSFQIAQNSQKYAVIQYLVYILFVYVLYLLAGTARSDHNYLFGLYGLSFTLYLFLYSKIASKGLRLIDWVAWLMIICVLLASPPIWSDDVFRFVWDGRLSFEGANPYRFTPSTWVNTHDDLSQEMTQLYSRLNSKDYFSVYPPLKQLFFYGSAWLSPNSLAGQIWVLKGILLIGLIFTAGVTYLFTKDSNRNPGPLFLLLFNPLLLTESLVNLHFEIWQLGFLMASLWLVIRKKNLTVSAVAFGIACLVKLLPLLLLPFFVKYLGFKKGLYFTSLSLTVLILSFIPWIDFSLLIHILDSINLYFQHFEFNASVYYLIRSIGYMWKGYNIIAVAGPILASIVIGWIAMLFFLQKRGDEISFMKSSFYGLSAYFLMATTVHPWYIITLLGIGVWVFPKTVLIWTFLTFFSYHAYQWSGVQECVFWSIASYCLILAWHIYWYGNKQRSPIAIKV